MHSSVSSNCGQVTEKTLDTEAEERVRPPAELEEGEGFTDTTFASLVSEQEGGPKRADKGRVGQGRWRVPLGPELVSLLSISQSHWSSCL